MINRAERRAAGSVPGADVTTHPAIALQSVNFSVAVAGPGGGAGIGWVAGQRCDELAYLPTLGLVAIRKGVSETAHPLAIVTRMVTSAPLLGEDS